MSTLEASLRLNIAQYQAGLAKAKTQATKFKSDLKRDSGGMGSAMFGGIGMGLRNLLPAASAAGAVAGLKSILNSADDLADAAERLNEMPEVIQRVGFAAQQTSSVGIDGLVSSFTKLEKALGDTDNKAAAEALERYGITAQSLIAMPLDQKVLAIADAFTKARSDGTGYNDLTQLIGRSAADLIPLFQTGKTELEAMFAGAPAMANETVFAMAAMNDQIDAFFAKGKSNIAQFLGVGLMMLDDILDTKKKLGDNIQGAKATADTKGAEQQTKREQAAANIAQIKADQEARAAQIKGDALRDVQAEMNILREQAAGHTKKAEAMRAALEIAKEQREIVKATGVSEAQALQMAKETMALKKQIAGEGKTGERKKIQGYSQKQGGTDDKYKSAQAARDAKSSGLDDLPTEADGPLRDTFRFNSLDNFQRQQKNPTFDPNQFRNKTDFMNGARNPVFGGTGREGGGNPLANQAGKNAAADAAANPAAGNGQIAQQILQIMQEMKATME